MATIELIKAVEQYDAYIAQHGVSEDVIEAYISACKTALIAERDIEYGLKLTGIVKQMIREECRKRTCAEIEVLEKYCYANKVNYRIMSQYYEVLLLEAQNRVLDSYLLYLEKNRNPREKFYAPKRKQFMKIGLIQALQDMLDDKLDILSISLPPGTGKAQPLYSKVLTPNGFVRMGDIKVGDKVIAGNGSVAKVLGVFPQGNKPIYRITLDDGSCTEASDEHLWYVQTREDRNNNKYRVVKTVDMLKNFRVENGKRANYSIDYVPRIEFEHKEFVIHPYVLGVLIGDGYLSATPTITNADSVVLYAVDELLPEGYTITHKERYTYMIHGHEGNNCKVGSLITKEIKRLGLFGCISDSKFIPKEYLYANYEQRLWLLRGLLDTDGSAENTCIEYTTVSPQLAEDVAELVHSLGGYCSVNKKETHYTKDGERIQCKDCYRLIIQFSSEHENPFYLPRKAAKYQPKRKVIKRFIENIEYIGEEECQCIYISDPCHLYITDDYIITHNTTLEKFFHSALMGWETNHYNLFYSHSSDITRMYYEGVLNILTDTDEYTWNEIFPDCHITSTNAKLEQINVGKYKPFPNLQTTSVGSKNAGKVRCNGYLLVDDMIGGIEEALNKSILDKLWDKYAVDARQRKIQDGKGCICKEIHIATRWSVHDVIGRLQRAYEGNNRVRFIAIPDIDPDTGKSNFDYEFNGFSVEFFNDQAKLMDDISYKCLYKSEPIEREGLLYHEDDIRRYITKPDREPDAILGVCDTKNKGSDFMVLPVMYKYGEDYYMEDCICDDSADYGLQYSRLSNLILAHQMQQVEFESNSGGDRVAHEVSMMVQGANGRCNITTKPTETNKETRIIVNSDWVKKHILFKDIGEYSYNSDYGKFMQFLLSYSVVGKNEHDDVCDCVANFALYATKETRMGSVAPAINPFRNSSNWYYGGRQ